MIDLTIITSEDVQCSIAKLVPIYQRKLVISSLNLSTNLETEFDNIGLSLTGEKQNLGFIIPTSSKTISKDSMWSAIKIEIFNFLCTNSPEYKPDREKGIASLESLITIVATAISSRFNIAIGVITGAVTVAIISMMKISKNAWCTLNTPQKIK